MSVLSRFTGWVLCVTAVAAAELCSRVPCTADTWSVVNLNPASARSSIALAVGSGLQGGVASYPAAGSRAAIWQGTAASYEVLYPMAESYVRDIAGTEKVGSGGAADQQHALLWQGPGNAMTDLHPAGATSSEAFGLSAGAQAGVAFATVGADLPLGYHAALWYGSAGSFVDLSPVGSTASVALGIDGSAQIGNFRQDERSGEHAALWYGTAESVVDLHPTEAYASSAQAISNGRQGGYVQFERDGPCHAALWSGTAESFFDLNAPGGPTISGAIYGMDGNVQVGQAGFVDGTGGATIWFGTPESAFFLGGLLPDGYTKSEARAVDIDEFGTIRVVGYAYNNNYYLPDGTHYPRNEAMMWVLVPEPSSLAALAAGLAGLAAVRRRR